MDIGKLVKKVSEFEPEVKNERKITVADLTHQLNAVAERMGRSNPNKLIVFNAAYALQQLVMQLEERSKKVNELYLEVERLKKQLQGPEVTIVRP